ncbi:MAG: PPC domain-containing protein [Anaerolineae bacterium]|nr:PPC domain-containing protein [Anaerolineae bacterium]MCA9892444.1 PPC domain-containing protein [Anaerolineae bacterium]MCB9460352.1 PPC domain-containing protein [Anaerolineaceae bacterium]
MTKKLLAIFAVFTLVAMLAGNALAQNTKGDVTPEPPANDDTTVPEGDAEEGLILPMLFDGDSFTDVLAGNISARLYVFNGSAGDVVTVSMLAITSSLDPFLVLLGPAGELIAINDDINYPDNLSARIDNATLPTSGSYFILATTFETHNGYGAEEIEGDEAEFEMSISGVTPPTDLENFDPQRYTYFTGAIGMDETVEGYSTAAEPVFYYLFDGVEGETFDLTLESQNFDTVLHLFGTGGDRLAVNDDADETTYNSAITSFTVPETGRYLIFATDYFFTDALTEDGDFIGGDFVLSMTSSK